MKKIVIYLITLLIALTSCGTAAKIKKADKKFEIGEYYNAISSYAPLYKSISARKDKQNKAYVAYKLAESYRYIGNSTKAEIAYFNALRYGYTDSIILLHAADVLRKNGKHKDAAKCYEQQLSIFPNDVWAKNGLEACLQVDEWNKKVTRYEVKNAAELNSRKSEFSPAYGSSEGSTLYITSSRDVGVKGKVNQITGLRSNDVFFTRQNAQGNWEEPELMEGDITSDYDEGSCSFTADGRTMYFTRCRNEKGESLGAEIWSSKRAGVKWSAPKKEAFFKDSTITVAHPAISPDGTILYFVSDAPGGQGGKDIWMTTRNADDTGWSYPQNLGKEINTPGDEMFPSVRYDGTLYFASNGLPGFGGLDIFKATLVEKKWQVENLMTPINSSDDDFGITFEGKKDAGFFSSNRKDPKGYDHIYSFVLPELLFSLEGTVTDNTGEVLSDATIRIVGSDGTNAKVKTRKNGTYRFNIQPNVNYILLATARGFLNQKDDLNTNNLDKAKVFTKNFTLASVTRPVRLDNIFFEFGKWDITEESGKSLDGLIKILNDNPNITIEIGAHTDMIGSEESNLQLSEKRAQSVVEYLIKKGIASDRLTPKGYGKSQPKEVDKAMIKKYPFMKYVENLSAESIELFTDEQKEIANQINRRTEFRVLKTTYKMH